MNMSDLMWFLSEVPFRARKAHLEHGHEFGFAIDFKNLIVYHVTKSENIEDIKAHGIKARHSQQSYERPAAVYFFADKNEITQVNLDILGLSKDYKIIRVSIPVENVIESMQWDGLYNVSFETSHTAVQYFGDIPTEWILSYDYKI